MEVFCNLNSFRKWQTTKNIGSGEEKNIIIFVNERQPEDNSFVN
jgi:hypothetical protein